MVTTTEQEIKELRRLEINELRKLQHQLPAGSTRSYLEMQEHLRSDLKSLREYQKSCSKGTVVREHVKDLFRDKLSEDAQFIVREMVRLVFGIFEEGKVPVTTLNMDNVLIGDGQTLWVSGLQTEEMSDQGIKKALTYLENLIKQFVGRSMPRDINHLIHCIHKANSDKRYMDAIAMHPSLMIDGSVTTFLHSLYGLLKHKASRPDVQKICSKFSGTCDGVVDYQVSNWSDRILQPNNRRYQDASWIKCYNQTALCYPRTRSNYNYFVLEHNSIILFMRSSACHYGMESTKEADRARAHTIPRSVPGLENDLLVYFPVFLPQFVEHMVLLDLFRDKWIDWLWV